MPAVFLFDLDGTLTSVELLPLIARELGLEAAIRQMTEDTMAGKIPFDESFRKRVELIGSVPIDHVVDIVKNVPLHEELMAWVEANSDRCWVVTGNLDCWVEGWLHDHGLRGFTSTSRVDGTQVHVDQILRKEAVLDQFPDDFTVMVGDGANDAQIISDVDVGIGAAIVHPVPPVVMEVADYIVMEERPLCRLLQRLS